MPRTPTQDHTLIDAVKRRLKIRTDMALANHLGLHVATISKIRNRSTAISDDVLLELHEATEMPIAELRDLFPEDQPDTRVLGRRQKSFEHPLDYFRPGAANPA